MKIEPSPGLTILDVDGTTSIHIDYGRHTWETCFDTGNRDARIHASKLLFENLCNYVLGLNEFDITMAILETEMLNDE
jgi:hypothetical protein